MNRISEKLHLGCGLQTPEDWLNVDGSWNARLAKYPRVRQIIRKIGILPREQLEIPWSSDIFIHDVRLPFPFEQGSFRCIYSSHLLEHLYWEEGQRFLAECFRLLNPGGILRIVVPDLKVMIEEYMSVSLTDGQIEKNLTRADLLNDRLLLRPRRPQAGNLLYRIYTALNDFHTHKWMYDADSLTNCFYKIGFIEVKEMAYRDSRIPGISDVEDPGRVLDGAGICVEGMKPELGI